MITKITIEDNKNTPVSYLSELKTFGNGRTFEFKPGINIIVGSNGCGKSTLLSLIHSFTFTESSACSKVPDMNISGNAIYFPNLYNNSLDGKTEETLKDGVKIEMDYVGLVFRFLPASDIKQTDTARDFDNFGARVTSSHSSTGEITLSGVNRLFQEMFGSRSDYNFPIKKLIEFKKTANDIWSHRFDLLLEYYKTNQVKISPHDYEYTVLMDEPDRNLDINNTKTIFNILSTRKELTQVIAVVHNPAIIYKLSKLDYVNFIELEDGYVSKIVEFIEHI